MCVCVCVCVCVYVCVYFSNVCMLCAVFVNVCVCVLSLSSPAIGKHFRLGSQEDAHEFLRYFVDSMQKSCLHGLPPKYAHTNPSLS